MILPQIGRTRPAAPGSSAASPMSRQQTAKDFQPEDARMPAAGLALEISSQTFQRIRESGSTRRITATHEQNLVDFIGRDDSRDQPQFFLKPETERH